MIRVDHKGLAAAALLLTIGLAGPAIAQTTHVQVWVRSFIPSTHPSNPGYMRPVPGQPGKTMIPGPGVPGSNDPLPWVGSCYNTNNRSFSAAPDAPAKVATTFSFDTDGASVGNFVVQTITPPKTEQYDCTTGAVTCSKTPTAGGVSVETPIMKGAAVSITMKGEGTNPCFNAPDAVVPSIRFAGEILIDTSTGLATYKGSVGGFPSYEAYVSINNQPATKLFNQPPLPGSTAWSLLRSQDLSETVRYAALDGAWTSTDPGKRFTLTIAGTRCVWTERTTTGQTLSRTLELAPKPGEGYTLLRANTDVEVLTFLGFSPSIQQAILARGPRPSFLKLKLAGNTIIGAWSGLLVIKDDKAQFKDMKQPGDSPPKPYTFTRS